MIKMVRNHSSEIYVIRNLIHGKSYVDKVVNFEKRMRKYCCALVGGYHKNIYLQRVQNTHKERKIQSIYRKNVKMMQNDGGVMYGWQINGPQKAC